MRASGQPNSPQLRGRRERQARRWRVGAALTPGGRPSSAAAAGEPGRCRCTGLRAALLLHRRTARPPTWRRACPGGPPCRRAPPAASARPAPARPAPAALPAARPSSPAGGRRGAHAQLAAGPPPGCTVQVASQCTPAARTACSSRSQQAGRHSAVPPAPQRPTCTSSSSCSKLYSRPVGPSGSSSMASPPSPPAAPAAPADAGPACPASCVPPASSSASP